MRAFLVLAAAAFLAPAAAGAGGPILFASDRDGDYELYAARRDGSGLRKLTRNRANDHTPVWSPDGRRIAFVSDRDGDEEIWVMRADGSNARQVTRNRATDLLPSWAPSGRRLAYASTLRGNFDVYTIRLDGSGRRRLTSSPALDVGPDWSPNGRRIAFGSNRLGEGNFEIFTMRRDGSDVRRITFTGGDFEFPEDDSLPAWSPDGSRIAFESNRHGSTDLYVVDADGGNETRLTFTPAVDEGQPAWSPGGGRLVFDSHRFERPFVVEVLRLRDGLRSRVARGISPDWRPAAG